MERVEVLVEGGNAKPGPPLGPALGPLGVDVGQVVKAINEQTASFQGMRVPVVITVDPETRSFTIEVGIPPTAALILSALGAEKGASKPGQEVVGNLTLKKVKEIAARRLPKEKEGISQILGTCASMGVTVDGKDPKEIQRAFMEKKEGGVGEKKEADK